MKFFKQIILILIIFFKTGNLFSNNNVFIVNNILIENKENKSSKQLTNQAFQKAFNLLIKKILLAEDISKMSNLNLSEINNLVSYYNISENSNLESNKINFNVVFDRDKIHNLFNEQEISYSNIQDKEFFILPIKIVENEIFIFSNNYFYDSWTQNINKKELIEFILPLENIEIIQKINQARENLLDLNISSLLSDYKNRNLAMVLIYLSESNKAKIFIKAIVQGKIINKSLTFKTNSIAAQKFNEKIIYEIRKEIINLVKSQNLIDIRTPSFLNVKLNLDKKNNLAQLKTGIKKIDLIENIFVQEFNKNYVYLKIKYLGKLENIKKQLKNENINLRLVGDEWFMKIM